MGTERLKQHLLLFQQQEHDRLALLSEFDAVCREVVLPKLKEIKYTFRDCGVEASTSCTESGGKITAVMFAFKRIQSQAMEFESHLVLRLHNEEIQLETRWCGVQSTPQLQWVPIKSSQLTAEWLEDMVYEGIQVCYPAEPFRAPEIPGVSEEKINFLDSAAG